MGTMAESDKILVVDDAPVVLRVIKKILADKGYRVFTATNAVEAISILDKNYIDLVITDLKMPKVTGLNLVRHIRENYRDTEVIMITGYPSIESAIEAVKTGVEDYLPKPFTGDELFVTVRKTLQKLKIRRKEIERKDGLNFSDYGLIGKSKEMIRIFESINRVTLDNRPVHLLGEYGTGKELIARTIHYSSIHGVMPFITINCNGIPTEYFETELMGYFDSLQPPKGSSSENTQIAPSGTMYLHHICDLSLTRQETLLKILQSKYLSRESPAEGLLNGIKIVSSSYKDVLDMVKKKSFLEDLFFQLNYTTINVPPLRERGDDIPLLFSYFAENAARKYEKMTPQFSNEITRFIRNYRCPGNVAELKTLAEFLIARIDSPRIDVASFTSHLNLELQPSDEEDLTKTLNEIEIDYIKKVLKSVRGSKTKAAEILDVDRKTLRKKLMESGEPDE